MKTAIYFLFTIIVSCACLEPALGNKHPWLLYLIGFGIWVPFVRYCNRVSKRRAERRQMEQQFQDFARMQSRSRR